MSKIWKKDVKVVKKFNLKQRLEFKLTALVVKNLCPNFQNLASQENLVSGGLLDDKYSHVLQQNLFHFQLAD